MLGPQGYGGHMRVVALATASGSRALSPSVRCGAGEAATGFDALDRALDLGR